MLIDFGFDLAGRREPGLWRGAALSAGGALGEAAPLLVAYVVLDAVFSDRVTWAWVPWTTAVLVAVAAATWFFKARGGLDSFTATYGLVTASRLRLADHLRRLPMGFWTTRQTGAVSSVLTDEFALYTEIVTHVWTLVISHLAKPAALALALVVIDWRLGLVAVVVLPLAVVTVPWSHRLLNRASDRLASTKSRTHARLVEYAQGVRTLREYGQAGPFHDRLSALLAQLEREQMRTELAPAPALLVYKLVVWLGFAVLVGLGVTMVAGGQLAPTVFLLAALLSLQLFESAAELSNQLLLARFASRTLERIRELFDTPVQPDMPGGEPLLSGSALVVDIDDVSFAYDDRPAVAGVSATLRPGTVTALVGPSGSGKSTLAHLVFRLWDVDRGAIRVGDVDVRAVPLAELRRHVATVLQDVVLFHDTVAENICLGRPNATRDEVVAAAKAARAHGFIEALPEGYDTVLGEGGAGLSGGQRQRLSIARALLLDAPVLVLDEATSAVDPHNEALIQEGLSALAANRTVLVIAHRLWTVQHADQILVMDDGRVVERGTHPELLAEGGLYRRLWDLQQESRSWKLADATDAPPAQPVDETARSPRAGDQA